MAKVIIEDTGQEFETGDFSKTLLRHFHEHYIDWMQSCGGKGKCTTCKFIIRNGGEHLSPHTSAEWRYLANQSLAENERLACQVKIFGDVVVAVPSDFRLPHIRYKDKL